MSFPFFPLCTFLTLLPLVLSTPDRAPEALQSAPISLRWMGQNDHSDCLGAFSNHPLKGSVKVATKDGTVDNFTADRIVDITLDYTSPSGKDCKLVAWLQELCHTFAKPELIPMSSDLDPSKTASKSSSESDSPPKITPAVTPLSESGVMMYMSTYVESTIPSSPSSGPATPGQSTTKVIPPEAIAGIAIGSFAFLLSILLALLVWRRRCRQKAIESAPSRAFWRSLDKKSPPVS